MLFEVFSQRYERTSTLVTSNLPFDEWTEVFGSQRLTGALLDRLTHQVHILEMAIATGSIRARNGSARVVRLQHPDQIPIQPRDPSGRAKRKNLCLANCKIRTWGLDDWTAL